MSDYTGELRAFNVDGDPGPLRDRLDTLVENDDVMAALAPCLGGYDYAAELYAYERYGDPAPLLHQLSAAVKSEAVMKVLRDALGRRKAKKKPWEMKGRRERVRAAIHVLSDWGLPVKDDNGEDSVCAVKVISDVTGWGFDTVYNDWLNKDPDYDEYDAPVATVFDFFDDEEFEDVETVAKALAMHLEVEGDANLSTIRNALEKKQTQ